jgi:hypothetical protein
MRRSIRDYPTATEAADIGARFGFILAVLFLLGDLVSGLVQGDTLLPSAGKTLWIVERVFMFDMSVLGGVIFAEVAAVILRRCGRLPLRDDNGD